MSRTGRILRNVAIGAAALAVLVVVAAFIVLHNARFQNYVRGKIVAAIAEGTGGATEIGSFRFDASHLHAHIGGLVIHGREPAGAAPFVRVASVDADLRLFGPAGIIGVSNLEIGEPAINIMVLPDGSTNLPTPRSTTPSKNTPLETIVDLAVGHFQIRNGTLDYESRPQPLDLNVNNLHAQLWFHQVKRDYEGRLSLQPVYVTAGGPTPVAYSITVPVVLERDAVRIDDAVVRTEASAIHIRAAMENLRQPRFSGTVFGRITLADLRHTLGLPLDTSRNDTIDLAATGSVTGSLIQLSAFHVAVGHSAIEGSGTLRDPAGGSPFRFSGRVALAELARIARSTARPEGELILSGEAALDPRNQYRVSGHVYTQGLGLRQGTLDLRNLALATDVLATPAAIDLSNLRADGFGGDFSGGATLRNFASYRIAGTLHHFDVGALARLAGRPLPYSGAISGPVQASGDLKTPGLRSVDASADLSISPGMRGIPVHGRLQADYSGSGNDVRIRDSYLALPHSRLNLAGSIRQGLHIFLVTHDVSDLMAALPSPSAPAVRFAGGQASFIGVITGTLAVPHLSGQLAANRFAVQGRQFDSFGANVDASPGGAAVSDGVLARGTMLASFSGTVGMEDWKPEPGDPLSADVTIRNADLADLMVLAGQPNQDFSGGLMADAHVNGTLGNPGGSVTVHIVNGAIHGEPFDSADARANLAGQTVTLQSASLVSGSGRADLTGEFQHPQGSFSTGRIHAHLQTNQVDLARLRTVQNRNPGTSGQIHINADVTGDLGGQFQLTGIQADVAAGAVHFQGQNYGDLQATARTSGQAATIDANSNFAGSSVRIHSTTQLVRGYPTNADAQIDGLPVESALAAAGRPDIPVKGKLAATVHLRNAPASPEGDASFSLSNGLVEGETIDRLQGNITYTGSRVELSGLEAASGPSHVTLAAQFDHPAGSFDSGTLQFRLSDGHLDLGRSRNIQKIRPGLEGAVEVSADGAATLGGANRILLTSLNGSVNASNVAAAGQKLGSLSLTARTASGKVAFRLNSDLAGAEIQGSGNGELSGNYPLDAQITFRNVKWTRIQALTGAAPAGSTPYEISGDGKASINGPILQIAQAHGSVEIDHLQLQTEARQQFGRAAHPITIQNQEPVVAALDQGMLRLTSFHFSGPKTDIQASGTLGIQTGAINGTANAGIDLALLQEFSPDLTSSGNIAFHATARGTLSDPQVMGQLELHNANVNYAGISNGLSNANGVVLLRGNRATIQNLTGESGGGKVTMSGFATFGDIFRFALRANAANIRVRPQEGVSLVVNADIHGAGTLQNSTTTGTITIQQLNYSPQSDIGSILTRSEPTVESSATPSPLLDHMKLDVHVITSPAMRVQSSLAENLQTDANLRVRGTASQPSILGRIDLTQGQLLFFGSTYTVNSGSISFFNPARIDPILNLSLETQSQGVDVTLNVTGPIDNMKLSYTSDPPLQFQEIIGLLAAGSTPTSDPVLLADQPAVPQQTLEQRGESAVVGQAIANPVANRLQRVFGITQLKIDPAFTGTSTLPTAQVTLQQKVSNQITFTYTTALDNPNSTLIQAEWALNPRWSATALRDQNGIVSVNLLYKRRFH